MSHESLRIVLSGLMGLSLIVGLIASWTWILVCLFTGRGILPARLIVRVPWREGSVVAVILLYVGLQVALGTALIEIQGRPDGSLSPQGIMLHQRHRQRNRGLRGARASLADVACPNAQPRTLP